MYCSKCGKKCAEGDAFCAACGNSLQSAAKAPEKKEKGSFRVWIFLLLVAVILVPNLTGKKQPSETEATVTQEIPAENSIIYSGRGEYTQEIDASLREETAASYEGTLLRYFRKDGTLAAEKVDYGAGCARVTHYDPYGNPLAVFEYDEIQGVYLEYYYDNIYDGQGRLCYQQETNKRGTPSLEKIFTYYSDGTSTLEVTEYHGVWVYTWDEEANGEDKPIMSYHAVISYDAAGQELSREEEITD